ncbi:MAG: winged helix-turn-helix transcriptional regulator [Methanosarcinales archaeon]
MEIFGKLCASENKNVRYETLKKKIPKEYHKNLSKTIKELIAMGLLRKYRKKNYALTKEGRKLAHQLNEEVMRATYSNLSRN